MNAGEQGWKQGWKHSRAWHSLLGSWICSWAIILLGGGTSASIKLDWPESELSGGVTLWLASHLAFTAIHCLLGHSQREPCHPCLPPWGGTTRAVWGTGIHASFPEVVSSGVCVCVVCVCTFMHACTDLSSAELYWAPTVCWVPSQVLWLWLRCTCSVWGRGSFLGWNELLVPTGCQ